MIASIILVSMFAVPALAQEPKPVKPAAVEIVTGAGEDPDAREYHRLFRAELNKRRDVAIRRSADWKFYLNITEITAKGKIIGYAGAVMVMSRDCKLYWLVVKAAATIEDLARDTAAALEKGFFQKEK